MYKKRKKGIKNNTVSNFYEPKRKKLTAKREINFFLKSNKKEDIAAFELQRIINNIKITDLKEKNDNKYKFSRNITFEKIKCFNNDINIFHIPIKTNMFIEKEYKINKEIIYKKNMCSHKNNYISKINLNKKLILTNLILIQKTIKKHIITKKIKYKTKPNVSIYYISKIRKIANILYNSSHNKIDNFSFKGNYFIVNSNSNKDKTSENDASNSKSENTNYYNDKDKQKFSLNYNNNLFSYENSSNKNNKDESFQTLLLKDKLKNIFNRYLFFICKSKKIAIIKVIRGIKFMLLIKKYINKKIDNIVIKAFKFQILKLNNKVDKNEDILDYEDIINIINKKRLIKNKPSPNLIIFNQKKTNVINAPKEYYINNEEGLANYIYNYFYNEKKFTNININLIKERLSKKPLIYRTQSNIKNYINDLHKDILENKICNNCFCKFEENCDIDCDFIKGLISE